jgi:hypothetical protein
VLAPEARRSLVVQRLSFSAALSGLVFAFLALPSALKGDMVMAVMGGGFAAAFFAAAFLGRACHPLGRPLLLGYSAFLLIGFPVGTIQGIFQIIHLVKPEAKLIFEGRDRFSAAEARQIAAFKTANAGLASWLRLVNFLAVIAIAGIVAAVAIPMLAR